MKKLYALLFTLSITTISAQAAVKHKIKSGDTLTGIAKKHHTSIAKVRKANDIKKGDILKVGKILTIPTKNNYGKYNVKKGDTLSAIAYKHQTSVSKIRKANGMKKGDILKLGKALNIPGKQYRLQKTSTKHTITTGDTLSAIAVKYGTSVSKLRKLNGMKKGQTLKLGRVLNVSPTKTYRVAKKKKETTSSSPDIFKSVDKKELSKYTKLTIDAKKKLGKKYVWGASGRGNTYDCSSFCQYVYRKNGISIPRTSIMQSKHGKYVKRKDLKKGDLIFFDTSKKRKGYVNHVGIYLGDNKFIHASSARKKVVVSNLSKFYGQRYKGARRPS